MKLKAAYQVPWRRFPCRTDFSGYTVAARPGACPYQGCTAAGVCASILDRVCSVTYSAPPSGGSFFFLPPM
jgi:hypothetical protein